jgi:hypothetical protein
MLPASAERLLAEEIGPDAVGLEIGGGGRPFNRSDWVMDLMPYETRGLYGHDGPDQERFTAETWIQRDICSRDPFPFGDDEIDFVICSHTLEDIRDPIWVCREMTRIARRGYLEVPSRLEEQSYGFQGPWAGWGHHRWLIDIEADRIEFVFKHHVLHARRTDHFPSGFRDALPMDARVQMLWWSGGFEFEERVFVSGPELDKYLADFVSAHEHDVAPARASLVARVAERAREVRARLRR